MSIKTVNRILAAAFVLSLIGIFGSAYCAIWFKSNETVMRVSLTSTLTLVITCAAGLCNNLLRQ